MAHPRDEEGESSTTGKKRRDDNEKLAKAQVGPDLNSSKTPLDHKLYRQILLPNGLWCILIQDTVAMHQNDGPPLCMEEEDLLSDEENENQECKKGEDGESKSDGEDEEEEDDDFGIRDAAAALCVGVGSSYDPVECQGMAHFLEHLLFMGSKKYPGENEFGAFVSKHGGSDNAWTEWECTSYHLSIPQEYLWPALDRLVQHFVSPLLLESAVDRELQAIESEFQLNKPSDECRRHQLQCATSNPDHMYTKFSWGNIRSLRDIPRTQGVDTLKELRKFFERFYYASNMRLVVMGAYSLDHMQVRVEDIFKEIPALPRQESPSYSLPVDPKNPLSWETVSTGYSSPLRSQGMPWTTERSLGKIFRIVPTKNRHRLILAWQIPSQVSRWKGKPYEFISHLLGHEGAGSLLSYLRKNHWATGCVAGVGDEEQGSSAWVFTFGVTLSEEGLTQWKSVVDATYEYIGMLRMYSSNNNWPDWLYEEMRQIEQVSYSYSDEQSPEDLVTSIVENMAPQYCIPPERVLDGFDLLFEFDKEGIRDLLDHYLTPTNMKIDFSSSSFGNYADMEVSMDPDSVETWVRDLVVNEEKEDGSFDPTAQKPQVEPNFETLFWCSAIPSGWLQEWVQLSQPQKPSLPIHLPPPNPFVPTRFDIKKLPDGDSYHPLSDATVKVCTLVGKKKQWFPATVVQYDEAKNWIRLSYEDEGDQWHSLDLPVADFKPEILTPDFEGTLDKKKSKFRVVSLAIPGVHRRFGDENGDSDHPRLPPIPPALPPNRLPKEISSTSTLRMWYLQDRNFHRPIAELRLEVICAKANETPMHKACAELLVELLHDACLETSYLASVCHLSCLMEANCSGFGFRFHGFDDKLLVLLKAIIGALMSFQSIENELPGIVAEGRFDSCLELLRRKYTNHGMYASSLSSNLRLEAIRQRMWSPSQKQKALADLSVPTFAKTVSLLLGSFAIESLIHGNITMEDAKRAKDLLEKVGGSAAGGLKRHKYPSLSIVRVPAVKSHTLITVPSKDPTEANTSVEVYVQVGKDNLRDRVLVDMLVQMMDDPIFNQIRTKDQFGYAVQCDSRWSYGIVGLVFKVVSNVKSAQEIVQRIDRFLLEFRKETLGPMKDDEFMEHLVAVCTQKLDMFNSMPEETDSYWEEIVNGRFSWQVWRDEAVELRNITKKDVVDGFDSWLHPSKDRKVLAIQVIGGGVGEVSQGRPEVPSEMVGEYADGQVGAFHRLCKNQTWGRINSKLA